MDGREGRVAVTRRTGHLTAVALGVVSLLLLGLAAFVDWLITEEKAPVKLGKLAYDSDDREGKMVATTMEKAFIFRVTAEEGADADAPSGAVIFEQTVEAN